MHQTKPLRTPHQFCIIHPNMTVFSSAQIKLPICPEVGVSIPKVPRFATVLAPEWMTVRPKYNTATPTYAAATLNASENLPAGSGPAAGNGEGRLQQTFESDRWETYNDAVRLYLMFGSQHAGKMVPIHVLLHDSMDELQGKSYGMRFTLKVRQDSAVYPWLVRFSLKTQQSQGIRRC